MGGYEATAESRLELGVSQVRLTGLISETSSAQTSPCRPSRERRLAPPSKNRQYGLISTGPGRCRSPGRCTRLRQDARLEPRDMGGDRRHAPDDFRAGTRGNSVPAHSRRTLWMSEWETPQKAMSISSSCAPGARPSNFPCDSCWKPHDAAPARPSTRYLHNGWPYPNAKPAPDAG